MIFGPHQVFSAGVTAADALVEDRLRTHLFIQNNGTVDVVVAFSETATLLNGIILAPGGILRYDSDNNSPESVPSDRVSIISGTASQPVIISSTP